MGRGLSGRRRAPGSLLFGCETYRAGVRARDDEGREFRCTGSASDSGGFSCGAACNTTAGDLQIGGRPGDSRATVCAKESEVRGEACGGDLSSWRTAAADVVGLALHVLLLECVWDERVSGESRVHRAVGELPRWHRLWTGVPRSRESWAEGRERVSGCGGGGQIPGGTRRCGHQAHCIVGRELRRVPDGAGAGAQFGSIRGGGGSAWRARLGGGNLG